MKQIRNKKVFPPNFVKEKIEKKEKKKIVVNATTTITTIKN